VNWISQLSTVIGNDFFLVNHKALVGLLILVFAKKSMKSNIRDVVIARKKLGFNNSLGNKGAVAIRMDINDSKL
jgi:hypothetical protein